MGATTDYFGAAYGQLTMTGAAQPIINGLTMAQIITVCNPSYNTGRIFIGDVNVTQTTGYIMEKGQPPISLDTANSRTRWYACTDGTTQTLAYVGKDSSGR
jgi:hypothetical protein